MYLLVTVTASEQETTFEASFVVGTPRKLCEINCVEASDWSVEERHLSSGWLKGTNECIDLLSRFIVDLPRMSLCAVVSPVEQR